MIKITGNIVVGRNHDGTYHISAQDATLKRLHETILRLMESEAAEKKCRWCGESHNDEQCPRVKRIVYDGRDVAEVEFHPLG